MIEWESSLIFKSKKNELEHYYVRLNIIHEIDSNEYEELKLLIDNEIDSEIKDIIKNILLKESKKL